MVDEARIEVDATGVINLFNAINGFVDKPPTLMWSEIQKYAQFQASTMYDKNKHGGTHREVTWKPFADVSIGSKRPSGERITNASNLMQDTGTLARRTGSTFVIQASGASFETRLPYAKLQHTMRPPLFWTDKDQNPVAAIARKRMEADAKKQPGVS